MHKKLQFIVFIYLILFLFNMANAAIINVPPTTYVVDKSDNFIHVCPITGRIESHENHCFRLDGSNEFNPNTLASTANGLLIYISSDDNIIRRCFRDPHNLLTSCHAFGSHVFNRPQSMATYPIIPRNPEVPILENFATQLYVTNINDNVIVVCDIKRGNIHEGGGSISSCKEAVTLPVHATSIAISNDNMYVYLGIQNPSSIVRCNINHANKTLYHCLSYGNHYISNPISVSTDPLHEFIYFLNLGIHNRGFTCKSPAPDAVLECSSSILIRGIDDSQIRPTTMYLTNLLFPNRHDSTLKRSAFVGATNYPLLMCMIHQTTVYECRKVTNEQFGNVNSILYVGGFTQRN